MINEKSGGMLYFIYNRDLISVLVCHDVELGEFVLQVPYYPPIESLDVDYTPEKCRELVEKTMVSPDFLSKQAVPRFEIVNINTWRLEGVIVDSMIEKSEDPQVILAGDAAHAFPPSGGFGMNTGIGDANCLAHKLARTIHHDEKSQLDDYNTERLQVAKFTRDFSIENHKKAIDVAKMLNLYKSNLDLYQSAVGTLLPSWM